ncbi:hypothetical protein yc1106_04278 [Curvularia clavata]|uniref:BAH domain-containing protein n=1 Tax=Curvularia clavata TaxID=95742 RepID=A0A9Q9DSQ6_CURCL|nr:hypothetical protein yc1106_04278 [Curvularia clavata]
MARKRKATHDPPSHSDCPNDLVAKKPKLDWSTIQDFHGFTVTAVNAKAQKKLRNAAANKHKTATPGKPPKYPGQDAPLDANVVQSNPFPQTELSPVHVKISPALHWESTSRYRKFTINSEEFQVGQIVFVKSSEEPDVKNPPNAVEGWLAKILEIRAGDSSHVFLRVFWVYRPEDLPGGRQPHHGSSEVIVSNHMDVIEAVTVQSLADTVHWNDDPDNLPLPADQLFFRQSYDITKRLHPFSALKKYCVDKQPINPDELLVQCSHCSEWLHARCLEQEAVRNVSEAYQATSPPLKKNNKHAKANGNLGPELRFDAKLSASDTGKVRLTITDNRLSEDKTRQRDMDVDVSCLMCGKVIERADDSLPSTDLKTLSGVAEENESENVTVTVTINTKDVLSNDAAAAVTKLEPAPVAPAGTNGEAIKPFSPV